MIRGLVLAGGKSSRFGSDKAQALYRGKSLLERAVQLLNEMDLEPVVAFRKDALTPDLKCTIIRDTLSEKGPLGGLHAAMSAFRAYSFLVLTCDMPLLTREALEDLVSDSRNDKGVILYSLDGKEEPFPGIYGRLLFDKICMNLMNNELSMHGLLETIDQKKVLQWKGEPRIFKNVNFAFDLTLPLKVS